MNSKSSGHPVDYCNDDVNKPKSKVALQQQDKSLNNSTHSPVALDICRLPRVLNKVGFGRSTLLNKVKAGTFPKPIRLGPRMVGWLASDVDGWIAEQVARAEMSL
jgi:prophage regulatory protein